MDQVLIARLNRASSSKFFVPECDLDWRQAMPHDVPLVPDGLLSLHGLPELERLSRAERVELQRHEVASLFSFAIRLENVLVRNFAGLIRREDPLDPKVQYYLHEIEEEARHSRMFAGVVRAVGVGAYPLEGLLGRVESALVWLTRWPTVFLLFTLASEELSDYLFARILADGTTHPLLRQVARIHRIEEARHICFARDLFRDVYDRSPLLERTALGRLAPPAVAGIFDTFVRPEVYLRAGVVHTKAQAWALWQRARSSEPRRALRAGAAARLVTFLEESGVIDDGSRTRWAAHGLIAR